MTGEVDTEQTEECPNVNRYVNRRTRVPFAPASGKVNIDKKSEFFVQLYLFRWDTQGGRDKAQIG